MKKYAVFISLMSFLAAGLFAQQKYALVIGNSAYSTGALKNAVNDIVVLDAYRNLPLAWNR